MWYLVKKSEIAEIITKHNGTLLINMHITTQILIMTFLFIQYFFNK